MRAEDVPVDPFGKVTERYPLRLIWNARVDRRVAEARYLLRAMPSMAGRFSRNASSLFLLSPWKWSSSASRMMAHRIRCALS